MNDLRRVESYSVEYPRQRKYLSSLSDLIPLKVIQPEVEINNKLFPARSFSKKLAISHKRTQSSIQLKYKYQSQERLKARQQQPKEDTFGEKINYSKSTISGKKKYLQMNYQQIEDNQRYERRFQIHRNNKDLLVLPKYYSTELQKKLSFPSFSSTGQHFSASKSLANNENSMYKSCREAFIEKQQINKVQFNNKGNIEEKHFVEDVGTCRSLSPSKRQFLKKGSNLQKQIVINLLKNKILREKEKNEKKQYNNIEILNMIKVYKGNTFDQLHPMKEMTSSTKQKDIHREEFRGWEHQNHNQEIYRENL